MEEYPTYDPNNKGSDFSIYINNLISSTYELGSIIKPLTMAAAIDSNTINQNDYYNDTGVRKIDDFIIGNYDKKNRGIIPISDILSESLNIGIIYLVEKMGLKTFQKYFKSFGLGQETGISLGGEVNSLVGNINNNIFIDNATAGFGQGIALTPIQTVRALS
ncbi:MAG: penicillin-binding transpeptidase domain-containing protein, partial [Cyanobium sp. MAG06]|nr:penicillin-binding transpeptidase domain-containing protein [Cyanobium sp. MAG06]